MFPGGAVPHYLEMEKQHRTATEMEMSNYVHMLGPFEVGHRHRIVGYPSRRGLGEWTESWGSYWGDQGYVRGEATVESSGHSRHLQEEAPTTGSSTASDVNETDASSDLLSGTVQITGYREGLSSEGTADSTLEVWYDIGGLDTALDFRVEMEDGPPSFCDDVRPGQVDADYPDLQGSEVADNIWHQIASTSDAEGRSQGLAYVDVGFKVDELFDHPVVLYNADDSVLACGILKLLVMEEDGTGESSSGSAAVAADDDTASPSPSWAGLVSWAVYLLFASSLLHAVQM